MRPKLLDLFCNRMIGLAGEDIARLLAAVAYLEKHSPEHLGLQIMAHAIPNDMRDLLG